MEKEQNYICEEDKLGNLPDDILQHVMSFLSSKDAVRTCVLSKRWSSLWKSLRYLHFDLCDFSRRIDAAGKFKDNDYDTYNEHSFINFIIGMLLNRHPTNLVKVHVNANNKENYWIDTTLVLELLICYALKHNVQELDISAAFLKPFDLPLSSAKLNYAIEHNKVQVERLDISAFLHQGIVFESSHSFGSLTKLKLEFGYGYNVLDFHLPALKSLELISFAVRRDQSFYSRIFSSCPNLQSLKVVDNFFDGDNLFSYDFIICAKILKNLEFSYSSPGTWFYQRGLKIVIDAPKLTTFKFNGFVPISFLANKFLTHLDQVDFD